MDLESKRIEELRSYLMLDTPKDIDLDEITKIASLVCETPIALISLVDENRQWFKSKIGLEADETPRNISFCTHAIGHDDIFIVEDAISDGRFKDDPLVQGNPNIRFYAGQPLKSKNGYNIGTLCVIDRKEKKLNKFQIDILKNLSKQIINYFEIYKKNIELEKVHKELIKKERLSSILNLSSGIAHEINNPLAIINGKIYLIDKKIKENLKNYKQLNLQSDFNALELSLKRIHKIVSSLRKFANSDEDEIITENKILDVIKTSLFFLQKSIERENIHIKLNINENLLIKCKLVNLSIAFYNIILNSYESLCKINDGNKYIDIECIEKDTHIVINFIDSGRKIEDKEFIKRIMEPFISAKEAFNFPKGLGLCVAKGIIESHKGTIIYDENSLNTKFVVTLNLK
nr:hypothetical protein GTC16762_31910 [Pigmentibacter ruber]